MEQPPPPEILRGILLTLLVTAIPYKQGKQSTQGKWTFPGLQVGCYYKLVCIESIS